MGIFLEYGKDLKTRKHNAVVRRAHIRCEYMRLVIVGVGGIPREKRSEGGGRLQREASIQKLGNWKLDIYKKKGIPAHLIRLFCSPLQINTN